VGVEAEALLALWEAALDEPAALRGDALLGAAAPSEEAPASLGARNARLLLLHERLFGGAIDLLSECPGCGTAVELGARCAELRAGMPIPPATTVFEGDGYRLELRLPAGADVAVVAGAEGAEEESSRRPPGDGLSPSALVESWRTRFALRLLERCVITCTREGMPVDVSGLPPAVLDCVSRHLEATDPGAGVVFTVTCPRCDAQWSAPLDVGELLWQKVQSAAERVLLDVDALARSYGWTELDVLRLSPLRRAAYLQLVSA
jgi:hypothetical protein